MQEVHVLQRNCIDSTKCYLIEMRSAVQYHLLTSLDDIEKNI